MKAPGVPIRIAIAAGLLAAALVGLVVREGAARAGGTEVRLQIEGYDPRSLLTGHFVRFQLRSDGQPGRTCLEFGDESGWVALREQEGRHLATGQAASRDAAQRLGELVVRGSAQCVARGGDDGQGGQHISAILLDLGIDRFHADQAQAEALETALQRRDGAPVEAFAVVSVGADGRARLKGLIINGQRHDLDWF